MAQRISDVDLERLAGKLKEHLGLPVRVSLPIQLAYALVIEIMARRDEQFRREICETVDDMAEEAVPFPPPRRGKE